MPSFKRTLLMLSILSRHFVGRIYTRQVSRLRICPVYEKMDEKGMAKRHPYAFMAFSAGPRNCIGLNYGLMAMKTFVAKVLRRYVLIKDNIVPVKDIRLKMKIALETVEPIKIRIEKRNRN